MGEVKNIWRTCYRQTAVFTVTENISDTSFLWHDYKANAKPEVLTCDTTSSWHNFDGTLIAVLNEKHSKFGKKDDFFHICWVYIAGNISPYFLEKNKGNYFCLEYLTHSSRQKLFFFFFRKWWPENSCEKWHGKKCSYCHVLKINFSGLNILSLINHIKLSHSL